MCKSKTPDKSDQIAFQKRPNHIPPVGIFPVQTPQFTSNLIFHSHSNWKITNPVESELLSFPQPKSHLSVSPTVRFLITQMGYHTQWLSRKQDLHDAEHHDHKRTRLSTWTQTGAGSVDTSWYVQWLEWITIHRVSGRVGVVRGKGRSFPWAKLSQITRNW